MAVVRRAAARKPSNRKPTLSPTRISTYLECAVKYRYIYLDKIGRFYLRSKSYYSFGSTLHHVLQDFHEQGANQTVEEMTTALETGWISAGYESTEQETQHRERGTEIVQAYHAAAETRKVARVETLFTEKTITCDMGPFKLSGRVDRIDRHPDGSLEIIDYKSGRLETTPEEVAEDLAMNLYQLILSRLYPDTPLYATIYCLRSGVTASAMLEGEARESFAADILTLGKEILERDYMALRPEMVPSCPTCDFLPRCAAYWQSQNTVNIADGEFSEEGL